MFTREDDDNDDNLWRLLVDYFQTKLYWDFVGCFWMSMDVDGCCWMLDNNTYIHS
jgi:hypothetical protein